MSARRLSLLGLAAATSALCLVPEAEADAAGTCKPQRPQPFLVRGTYHKKGLIDPVRHAKSIEFRTKTYGKVEGFGLPSWNSEEPSGASPKTSFMGKGVSLHKKVVPHLACVEKEIKTRCKQPYEVTALSGFRDRNTYRGGEVTNHLFGIALDIDPQKNPCCHCVEPWSEDPLCKKEVKTPYERAAMPRCWIDTFEKHGFYWLGHDDLEDTMHFEFLGKPSQK